MEGLSVRINKLFIREQTGELCRDVQGVSAVYTIKPKQMKNKFFKKIQQTHTPLPRDHRCAAFCKQGICLKKAAIRYIGTKNSEKFIFVIGKSSDRMPREI